MTSYARLDTDAQKRRKWPRDTVGLLFYYVNEYTMCTREFINWAVQALVDGFDTPSLVILAGLDSDTSYTGERYDYFRKSLRELGINISDYGGNNLVEFSRIVSEELLAEEIDVKEALDLLYTCYIWSDYSAHFLSVWYRLSDDLSLMDSGYGPVHHSELNKSNRNEFVKRIAEQYLASLETALSDCFGQVLG